MSSSTGFFINRRSGTEFNAPLKTRIIRRRTAGAVDANGDEDIPAEMLLEPAIFVDRGAASADTFTLPTAKNIISLFGSKISGSHRVAPGTIIPFTIVNRGAKEVIVAASASGGDGSQFTVTTGAAATSSGNAVNAFIELVTVDAAAGDGTYTIYTA